jgi:four helix bundle protein
MEDGRKPSRTLRSFRDLDVYKLVRQEAKKVFLLSKRFPPEERYSLTDQIRRSSRAVGSMIAEAWVRRRYEAAFISKLNEALGEAMETQSWLDSALDCEYMDEREHHVHDSGWQSVGAMLNRMIERSETFCPAANK